MMHDFNSVSGMWSDIQLKGRAGRRGGEGTNVEGIEREREKEEGRGHSSTLSLVGGGGGGFGQGEGQQRGKEKVEGGGEERDGGEGLVWLLSASHVSKPVLKNE